MSVNHAPLSAAAACELNDVIRAVMAHSVVRYLDSNDVERRGTLRHITAGPDTAASLGRDQDVRDGWIRVTLDTGWERWETVGHMAHVLANGGMAVER